MILLHFHFNTEVGIWCYNLCNEVELVIREPINIKLISVAKVSNCIFYVAVCFSALKLFNNKITELLNIVSYCEAVTNPLLRPLSLVCSITFTN